jgi:hypothetical protein
LTQRFAFGNARCDKVIQPASRSKDSLTHQEHCSKNCGRQRGQRRIRQRTCPIRFNSKQQGRRIMAKIDVRYLPRGNPCAQCSAPIAAPDWIENGPGRASYLWHCQACDYRFEAVAFFQDSETDRLAA